MNRVLLTVLAVLVVTGLIAAIGYAGYRYGYMQGSETGVGGAQDRPGLHGFDEFRPRRMPMHDFGFVRGGMRGFGGFPLWGLGIFSVLGWLAPLVLLTLGLAFLYWLLSRSGWRLRRETPSSSPPASPDEPAP